MKMPLTGPAMLLKSFGIDPNLIQEKITQAEKLLNDFTRVLQERLSGIESRLTQIEVNQIKLQEIITQASGDVIPAGCSPNFYTQEKTPYGK